MKLQPLMVTLACITRMKVNTGKMKLLNTVGLHYIITIHWRISFPIWSVRTMNTIKVVKPTRNSSVKYFELSSSKQVYSIMVLYQPHEIQVDPLNVMNTNWSREPCKKCKKPPNLLVANRTSLIISPLNIFFLKSHKNVHR